MKKLEAVQALTSVGAERFEVDQCNQIVIDVHEVTLLSMKDFSFYYRSDN